MIERIVSAVLVIGAGVALARALDVAEECHRKMDELERRLGLR